MNIAVVQFNPKTAALRSNAERALAIIDSLAESTDPPDLVVFPALALSGANVKGLIYHNAFAAECIDVLRDFMERSSLPTLLGTLVPRHLEDCCAFICEPEVIFCRDGKGSALGFVDVNNELSDDRYASSIDFEFDGLMLTVVLNDYPEPEDDFSGSDLVVLMLAKEYGGTSSLFTSSTQIHYLRMLAEENEASLVVANLTGAQDEAVYDGASIVLDRYGGICGSAEPFDEQVLSVNINMDGISVDTLSGDRKVRSKTKKDKKIIKPLLPCEADWRALRLALHDYTAKNGFTDVVFGLSGGIDSACVAALAAEALGNEHVHGVIIPGPFSKQESINDALSLADSLGIPTLTISITDLFNLSRDVLGQGGSQDASSIALENLQARLRMIVLMYLANVNGWLLLNTGNKSETAVGYTTLYGDAAGGFSPIGNLYKTDIYELLEWRNGKSPVVPHEIMNKAPSAELHADQLDTDSLPSYEVLDRILRLHIEDDYGIDEILEVSKQQSGEPELDPDLIVSVLEMVKRAEFKRRQSPQAPTLGTVAMVDERNWPVTCGFIDYDRKLIRDSDIVDWLDTTYIKGGPQGADILKN